MKKVVIFILSIVLAFGAFAVMMGCNDAAAQERITQLEQELADLRAAITGPQGPQGNPGADGTDGLTPRIESGYWWIGTTNTGITAQGPAGSDGIDGVDGLTPRIEGGYWWIGAVNTNIRAQGPAGTDGITPHIGTNGNWFVGTQDTGVSAQGTGGGTSGITPHIGTNGNWFIGTQDTGVRAQGPAGPQGDTGAQGPTGPQGDTGPQGLPGESGADGATWHTGIVAPTSSTPGNNGDLFLNTVTGNVYRRIAGAWELDGNIRGPQGESGVPTERVYQLGETFTYRSHTGLKLFSIRVESDVNSLISGFAFHVTNYNMPGYAPSSFVRLRTQGAMGGGVYYSCNASLWKYYFSKG